MKKLMLSIIVLAAFREALCMHKTSRVLGKGR
jgi:hypothetical protein